MRKATQKQLRFIQEYLYSHNAEQAALRAGYNPTTARQQTRRILESDAVRDAIYDDPEDERGPYGMEPPGTASVPNHPKHEEPIHEEPIRVENGEPAGLEHSSQELTHLWFLSPDGRCSLLFWDLDPEQAAVLKDLRVENSVSGRHVRFHLAGKAAGQIAIGRRPDLLHGQASTPG